MRAGVEILSSRLRARAASTGSSPVWQGDTLHQVRARRLVFATGAIEQPLVFAGNDLPGVMLAGGARRLVALYGVAPGRARWSRPPRDRGLEAARALRGRRRRDRRRRRPAPTGPQAALEAEGRKARRGAARRCGRRSTAAGRASSVECDLLVVSGGVAPATSLLAAGRRAHRLRRGARALRAGRAARRRARRGRARRRAATTAEPSGELAGLQAAHALGLGDAPRAARRRPRAERRAAGGASPPAVAGAGRGKCFACLCEDVTAKDIAYCVDEGYDSIELSKRYTTVTMGPCQGRMCQLPAVRLMAQETGQDLGRGRHDDRAAAVVGGADGGARPAARSSPPSARPIHARHRELGARRQVGRRLAARLRLRRPGGRGARRPRGGRADRRLDARQAARPRPEAGAFLDRLYPNRFSNLKPGRIRYGVLTSRRRADHRRRHDLPARRRDLLRDDDLERRGRRRAVVLLVAGRLGHGRPLTDLTQGARRGQPRRAARPRDPGRLTDARLLQRGLPLPRRPSSAPRRRRPVPAPADRLRRRARLRDPLPGRPRRSTSGTRSSRPAREHGLRPFGLEPQRILRLQKLHIIVGQDTDSESTPYGAGDAVDRQARQGGGLHRQVGARARRRARAGDARSSASRCPTATCRPRARWSSTSAASRSGR